MDNELDIPDSVCRRFADSGYGSLPTHLNHESEFAETGSAPASDRVVSLTDNMEAAEEARQAVDQVIAELEADTSLDNELGPKKQALVDGLKAGRQLLDDTTLSIKLATSYVLEPLKWVWAKYDQAVVAGLAAKAIDLVTKLFGAG